MIKGVGGWAHLGHQLGLVPGVSLEVGDLGGEKGDEGEKVRKGKGD